MADFEDQAWLTGPNRPPNWRDRLAREHHRCGRLPPADADDVVRRLHRLYSGRDSCHGCEDRARLRRRMRCEHEALEWYESRPCADPHVIECLTLGREEPARIAARLEASEEAVTFYRTAFFDVEDRLNRRDWILGDVIRLEQALDDPAEAYPAVMRFFSYVCGSEALQLFSFDPKKKEDWRTPSEMLILWAQRSTLLLEIGMCAAPEQTGTNIERILTTLQEARERWFNTPRYGGWPRTAIEKKLRDKAG